MNETTIKDWEKRIKNPERVLKDLSSNSTLNKVKLQVRFHFCIQFKKEAYRRPMVFKGFGPIKTGK